MLQKFQDNCGWSEEADSARKGVVGKQSKQSSKSRLRDSKDWGQEKERETRVKGKRTDKKIGTCGLKGGSG